MFYARLLPIIVGSLLLLSCQKDGLPMVKVDQKTGNEDRFLAKHNFRSAEKDGYKIEVWTLGGGGCPIIPGYRIYLPKGSKDEAPPTTVTVVLKKKDSAAAEPRKVSLQPALNKTSIEGGYWENIRVDDTTFVERKEKFIGQEGVWEVNLDDPFKSDPRNLGATFPPPGHYVLSIQVAIKGGPEFQFEDLPYRLRASRDPADN